MQHFLLKLACLCVALLVTVGCSDSSHPEQETPSPRLVVFSPGVTSMLFEMGMGDHIVGVTDVETLPEGETRPTVGNLLNVRAEQILAVQPDYVLVQMDPEPFKTVQQIDPSVRVEHFEIETLEDVPVAMRRIGEMVDQPAKANAVADAFDQRLAELRAQAAQMQHPRVLYVMGYRQPLSAGKDTFITQMIEAAGGQNIMADRYTGWFQPTLESIIALSPDVVICETSPERADEARSYWQQALRKADGTQPRVYLQTDKRWTIPGGHLIQSIEEMRSMIHGTP